jgi:hypothetical protein
MEDKVIQDAVFMDSDDSDGWINNGICSFDCIDYPRNTIYLSLRSSPDWNTCLVSGGVG